MFKWLGIGNITASIGNMILGAILIGVSAAALADHIALKATIRTLTDEKTTAQSQLATAQQNIGTCHANFRVVELAMDRQTAGIREWAAASKANDDTAAANFKRIEPIIRAAAADAKALRSIPPPAPADACMAAVGILRGVVP
jgi:hypothetical protein